ncbi:TPA: glutamate racemase [Candidatus Falkowbacteria bacterium]|nr:glutamate racemase [Candidatus Falkowbacteria bacterium]
MIGVFDSGLGGLTVLKELIAQNPTEDYLYLGDTAHLPYGNRSAENIYELTRTAVGFLFNNGAGKVIIACNTASAKALPRLEKKYSEKVIGVIDPVVEYFASLPVTRIGVIGTRATIGSDIYHQEIKKMAPAKEIFSIAAPLLVPLVEEDFSHRPETESILREYLNVLKLNKVEALILGCTHYPMLLEVVKKIMGAECLVPNPAAIVAEATAKRWNLDGSLGREGRRRYLVTDLTANFEIAAERFLGHKIHLEKINL